MRRISFALTQPQLLDGSKTVTRRLGWRNLEAGTELLGVNKCRGLKRGEKARKLARILVTRVTREPLSLCTTADAKREGFPHLTGAQFVEFFCREMRCDPMAEITRIEFEVLGLYATEVDQ